MEKINLVEKARQVFGIYPAAKKFFFTADGQAFSEESNANNHARGLEIKQVVSITQEQAKSGDVMTPKNPTAVVVNPGGAQNEFQAIGAKSESKTEAGKLEDTPSIPLKGEEGTGKYTDDREALASYLESLTGKRPAHNIGIEKMKLAILEAEKAKAEAVKDIDAQEAGKVEETAPKDEISPIVEMTEVDENANQKTEK